MINQKQETLDMYSVKTWCPVTSAQAPVQTGAVFRHLVPSLNICSHSMGIHRAVAHYCDIVGNMSAR